MLWVTASSSTETTLLRNWLHVHVHVCLWMCDGFLSNRKMITSVHVEFSPSLNIDIGRCCYLCCRETGLWQVASLSVKWEYCRIMRIQHWERDSHEFSNMNCKLFELLELGGFLIANYWVLLSDKVLEDHLEIWHLPALLQHRPVFLQLVTKANLHQVRHLSICLCVLRTIRWTFKNGGVVFFQASPQTKELLVHFQSQKLQHIIALGTEGGPF